MPDLYETIRDKIRNLRGVESQESLAKRLDIAPNTLSRWETGTYRPTAEDLAKIARLYKVQISIFFPEMDPNERISALTSATGGLSDADFEEVVRYAEFRKARKILKSQKTKKRQK